jgi:hypothetical protein
MKVIIRDRSTEESICKIKITMQPSLRVIIFLFRSCYRITHEKFLFGVIFSQD